MEIEREITLDASAEEVWRSLAAGDWLGPDAAIELWPAGEVHCGERDGFVEAVEEPRRLVFWWSAPGEEASRVEVELDEDEGGTVLRVVEARPLAILDVRGAQAIVTAPGPPMPEMNATAALH